MHHPFLYISLPSLHEHTFSLPSLLLSLKLPTVDSWEKISFDGKSLQTEAKSCDFILNPDVRLFQLLVVVAAVNKNEWLDMDQT